MARPAWEGHLRLSLVTCPVALYRATTEKNDIRFHMVHPKTRNRVRMIAKDPDLGEVERADLVKGYEMENGEYVLFDKRDFDAVRLESTKVLDIEEFVDGAGIDRLYWNEPYYLLPSGKTGVEAYAVIRKAMEQRGKIALGRLVMHTRERVCAIEARGEGMLLTTLRSHDEVLDMDQLAAVKAPKPDRKMLDIAEKIIDQQAGEFDPAQFTDRYEDALRELIAEKAKGKAVKVYKPEEPDDGKVVDLMQALKRSLKGDDADAKGRADRFLASTKRAAPKQAAKRAPVKRAPAKSSSARRRRAA